ncbi:MAG TPA: hypothetical protein VNK67_15275 [Burkholderiales bacterium]|nr:hypothetical protein [Burkholderiales bacterium]
MQVPAPSALNFFGVSGPLNGFSYTFDFAGPVDFVSFTPPALCSSSTMAAWIATALSATNMVLSRINHNFIESPNTPQATWTLQGLNIDRIEFFSNVQNFAGNNLIFDDVTFSPAAAAPEPAAFWLLIAGLFGPASLHRWGIVILG